MFGVDGQYLCDFEIGDVKNFIKSDDVFRFTINEYAGNILPDFKLNFVSSANLLSKLHEGTMIKAKLGCDRNSLEDMILYCTLFDSSKLGENHRTYFIEGFAVPLSFVASYKTAIMSKKSGIEAVIEVAKKTFKRVSTNVTKSNDSQTWIQPNLSDRDFIQKTLYRSDLGDSFPACAIAFNDTFIIKDIKKALADKSKTHEWKLIRNQTPKDKTEISYEGDIQFSSNSGMINKIVGYGFDLNTLDADTGASASTPIDVKPVVSQSKKIGLATGVKRKTISGLQLCENVHATYQSAFYGNVTALLNLSRVEAHLSIAHKYYPIRPLDRVMLSEADSSNTKFSAEDQSGIYFVSFVSRQVEYKQFVTTVKICRESMNGVK